MNIEVLEQDKEKMKVEFKDETQTVTQLLATQAWKEGGEAASIQEHPFLENPKIIVRGSNPKKILEKAAVAIQEQCDEFSEEFKRAMKK